MLFFHMTKLGIIDLSSTSAERCFLATLHCENRIFHFIFPKTWILDTPPKKLRWGHLKRFWRKKKIFPKKHVELRTFDGKCLGEDDEWIGFFLPLCQGPLLPQSLTFIVCFCNRSPVILYHSSCLFLCI